MNVQSPVHPSVGGVAPGRTRTDGRDDTDDLLDALVLGVRDYFAKQPFFNKALVGLSGGIDSALTAAIACLALGGDRVMGVTMPSKYSSSGSVDDSRALADALGLAFHRVPIVPAVSAFGQMLADEVLPGGPSGVTEENLQARTRAVVLMALSNAQGHLLLTTGNKSETAVGYATLYGDMAGGLAVLSDVFKTDVYRVARRVNERLGREAIPESTLTKPPSAELRPDQKDSDSLPPYDVLDPILRAYLGTPARRGRDRRPHGGRPRDGAPDARPRRPQRVQAAAGRTGPARHHEGLRLGPPLPRRRGLGAPLMRAACHVAAWLRAYGDPRAPGLSFAPSVYPVSAWPPRPTTCTATSRKNRRWRCCSWT